MSKSTDALMLLVKLNGLLNACGSVAARHRPSHCYSLRYSHQCDILGIPLQDTDSGDEPLASKLTAKKKPSPAPTPAPMPAQKPDSRAERAAQRSRMLEVTTEEPTPETDSMDVKADEAEATEEPTVIGDVKEEAPSAAKPDSPLRTRDSRASTASVREKALQEEDSVKPDPNSLKVQKQDTALWYDK